VGAPVGIASAALLAIRVRVRGPLGDGEVARPEGNAHSQNARAPMSAAAGAQAIAVVREDSVSNWDWLAEILCSLLLSGETLSNNYMRHSDCSC
jgi:hypothetical protein